MTIPRVPGQILEAVDGMFLVLLLFAFAATVRYTARVTAEDDNPWNPLSWSPESKAAWSVGLLFFGLILRVGSHWILRHATNHGLHWETIISYGQPTILFSTLLTTWGAICWIRAVIPLRCGRLTWIGAVLFAGVFGVYMAA